MGPLEIALIVIGSIVLLVFLLVLALCIFCHRMMFNHRFEIDPLQGVYTKEILELEAKPVEIPMGKITLRGNLYNHGKYDEDVIVVYCHGMWSSHRSYLQNIGFLAHQGYQVLGFDYEGVESSDGKTIRGFGNSLKCADYAIRFVKNHPDLKDREIYVVGHSWGGFATSNIAALHPDINGVVPMSPVIGVAQLMSGFMPKPLRFIAYIFRFIDSLKCGKYSYMNAIKSLKDYEGKVLFIHSTDDEMVRYNYSTKLVQEHCKNKNIEYYVIEGKGHQPHYTKEACDKLYAYNKSIKNMPKDELDELKRKTDFLSMGVIDPEVMGKVVELIEK